MSEGDFARIQSVDKEQAVQRAEEFLGGCSPVVNALWAKTGDETEGWLSLPQHVADSYCVATALWDFWVPESLKATLVRLTGLDVEQVKTFYCFLAAGHDVGKASPDFQILLEFQPEYGFLLDQVEDAGLSLDSVRNIEQKNRYRHDELSGALWAIRLKQAGFLQSRAGAVTSVVEAHHGLSADPMRAKKARKYVPKFSPEWISAQQELMDGIVKMTGARPVLEELNTLPSLDASSLQLLCGLVVMADWIASNQHAFPLVLEDGQESRIHAGLDSIDLASPWEPKPVSDDAEQGFQDTFGFSPRPLQTTAAQVAADIAEADGPALVIVEGPTGVGKTEAGLAIAQIVGASRGAQGVFFAAPTMATANGLYNRMVQWVSKSAQSDTVNSMYLAHSKSRLLKDFRKLHYSSIGERGDGQVVASQWTAGRKKGLLSNFGVGTIDQVLMLALQVRHSMLRHVALAGKVIIVDEAHAYDAYMSNYLCTALAWLARYGATVIVMSATLPPKQRTELAQAFASQLYDEVKKEAESLMQSSGYPLITTVTPRGVATTTSEPGPTDLDATVEVIDDGLDALGSQLDGMISEGGIALVICNTVRRAQMAFGYLKERYPDEVELHHSAFIAKERANKEDVLRKKLGPKASRGEGRPERLIVVATQVAEQSLDIDADLLITDLAPMDLIIQRAGRVHRHQRPVEDRPTKLRSPRILMRGVDDHGSVPAINRGSQAIYDPAVLLATYALLPKKFRRPDDIEGLVRRTYELIEEPIAPAEGWEELWEQARQKSARRRDAAEQKSKTFRIPEPRYAGKLVYLFQNVVSSPADEEVGAAQVRDAEPSIEVIAIERNDYGYRPFGDSEEPELSDVLEPDFSQQLRLAESTLRLPAWMTRRESDFDEVISSLEQQTPSSWQHAPLLKGQVALALGTNGEGTIGPYEVHYSAELGLRVNKAESV